MTRKIFNLRGVLATDFIDRMEMLQALKYPIILSNIKRLVAKKANKQQSSQLVISQKEIKRRYELIFTSSLFQHDLVSFFLWLFPYVFIIFSTSPFATTCDTFVVFFLEGLTNWCASFPEPWLRRWGWQASMMTGIFTYMDDMDALKVW